jgi:hypothetical protein
MGQVVIRGYFVNNIYVLVKMCRCFNEYRIDDILHIDALKNIARQSAAARAADRFLCVVGGAVVVMC